MQSKACLKAVLALSFACWLVSTGAAWAETYVGRLIAEDLFDRLKYSGRIAVWPLDAAQIKEAGLTPSSAAALSDNIRTAIQHIGASKGLTFVEREAIGKIFQEQQFAHNATESDFETLAHQANADALVLISIHRKNAAEIVVSARLVRAKGPAVGQLLVTSKTYEVAASETAPNVAAASPPLPAKAAPTAATPTVRPDTVTPTGATVYAPTYAYPTYYTYTPAYTVSPAPAYGYSAAPSYYVAPRYNVGFARLWWRR